MSGVGLSTQEKSFSHCGRELARGRPVDVMSMLGKTEAPDCTKQLADSREIKVGTHIVDTSVSKALEPTYHWFSYTYSTAGPNGLSLDMCYRKPYHVIVAISNQSTSPSMVSSTLSSNPPLSHQLARKVGDALNHLRIDHVLGQRQHA